MPSPTESEVRRNHFITRHRKCRQGTSTIRMYSELTFGSNNSKQKQDPRSHHALTAGDFRYREECSHIVDAAGNYLCKVPMPKPPVPDIASATTNQYSLKFCKAGNFKRPQLVSATA